MKNKNEMIARLRALSTYHSSIIITPESLDEYRADAIAILEEAVEGGILSRVPEVHVYCEVDNHCESCTGEIWSHHGEKQIDLEIGRPRRPVLCTACRLNIN